MFGEATALFSFGELFADFNFVLKIFVLLSIISFIKNHLGTGPLAIILILGIGYFVFFEAWVFFGGIYVLYMLLALGVSGILIDFFFVSGGPAGGKPEEAGQQLSPVSSGADIARRQAQMKAAHQAQARLGGKPKPPMRPGG